MTTLFHARVHFLFIPFGLPTHLLFIYIYYRLTTYSQSLTPHPTESELYPYSLLFIVLPIYFILVVKLQKVYVDTAPDRD